MAAPDYALMARLMTEDCESVVEALAITVYSQNGELHAQLRDGSHVVVETRGSKRGLFLDKSDGSGGDTLELVHRVLGKDDHRFAYDWGKNFFGIETSEAMRALAERRAVITERQARAVQEKLSFTDRVRRALARYVNDSVAWPHIPQIIDYLAGRGIRAPQLPAFKTLRFARSEYHKESGREWPAMVAPIICPLQRKVFAVHHTFLEHADRWRKAPIEPAKKVTATYKGGVIPLWRGGSGKELCHAPEGETLLMGEGIENSLAAALLLPLEPAPRVFAGVVACNLPHIKLPPSFAEVVLVMDRYAPGYENSAVEKAYDLAERNWVEAGINVTRQLPPVGFKDFAEALAAQG